MAGPTPTGSVLVFDNVAASLTSSLFCVLDRSKGENAVVVEMTPQGVSPSASLQLIDSADGFGFSACVDGGGTVPTQTGTRKLIVPNVLDVVKAQIAIAAGAWSVRLTPINAATDGTVGGTTIPASGSLTRPANTTAYAAGEVIGTASTDVITVAGAGRKTGGTGVVLDVALIDQGGATAAGTFELYLFSAAPTVQVDQAAFALVAADLAALVAVVPFANSYVTNVGSGLTGSRAYYAEGVNAGYQCAGGSANLYAVLVTRAAYTPVSGEVFTVIAKVSQD